MKTIYIHTHTQRTLAMNKKGGYGKVKSIRGTTHGFHIIFFQEEVSLKQTNKKTIPGKLNAKHKMVIVIPSKQCFVVRRFRGLSIVIVIFSCRTSKLSKKAFALLYVSLRKPTPQKVGTKLQTTK